MMSPAVLSPSASSLIGDYIGIESCFDLANKEPPCGSGGGGGGIDCIREKREQRFRMTTTKKALPPTIPRHMPWELKRYYTSDGRLILREEKVRFNEYLRAHRSNGRFILYLVTFDDHNNGFGDYGDKEAVASDDEHRVGALDYETENINSDDKEEDDGGGKNITVEDSTVKYPLETAIAANGGKCLKYNSVSASPTCFLGLPVHI